MSHPSPVVRALVREALEHDGRVSIARMAEHFVPIELLREIARRHALSPKGYRIDKAPAARLTPLLTDRQRPDVVEEVVMALADRVTRPAAAGTDPAGTDPANQERLQELEARLTLRDGELERARADLARCRSQATRRRAREAELVARADAAEQRAVAARAEADRATRQLESVRPADVPSGRDDQRRIHELERDLQAHVEAEEGLRRLSALRQRQVRELEAELNELRALVPQGKRKKREKPVEPLLAEHFRIPHFTPGFYKSLAGRERRHVERAFQAVLLFCTEGPGYPGLEVKPIEGQELWSLRASLKLRVYFVFRSDLDVEFLAVADREDQHTTLRRLKER